MHLPRGRLLTSSRSCGRRPPADLPEADIEKRKAEAITAIRQDEDNPAVRAVETFFELLYGANHPYGRRAKGTPESIERIDRPAMAAFHAAYVQPATLSLAVVGDVALEDVLSRASREMKDWRGLAAPVATVPPPPPATGRRQRVVAMPGKSQTDVAYGFATITRLDPRYYAYWMMNNVLGQFGLGGRLAENIRERQGMAYYASARSIRTSVPVRSWCAPASIRAASSGPSRRSISRSDGWAARAPHPTR